MKNNANKNTKHNFKVGMEIIATRSHSSGKEFKKGERFIVQGIKKGCKCAPILLDIGYISGGTYCGQCQMNYSNKIMWFGSDSFRPLTDEDRKPEMSKVSIEQLIKELEIKSVFQ